MQNPFPPSVKLKAIEDAQPLYDRPMIVFTLSPEDRMLLERILAFIQKGNGGYQEQGAIGDAIQARLARG